MVSGCITLHHGHDQKHQPFVDGALVFDVHSSAGTVAMKLALLPVVLLLLGMPVALSAQNINPNMQHSDAVASTPQPEANAPRPVPMTRSNDASAPLSPSAQASSLRFGPPAVDRSRFEPMSEEDRIMNQVKVKYAVREDGYEFCSRITGIPIRFNSQPMACAFWNVRRRECTIVTPPQTGYNYIGHELRHCFEGAFHD